MIGRRWLSLSLKITVSGLLLALLLSRLSLQEIRLALAHPRWGYLAAALGVYALSAVGGAAQWSWILRVAGVATPLRELHRLYFVGLFFNNFLPANVGGDAVKIFDLGRQEGRPLKIFCSTLLDRLLGLSSLTLLALLAVGTASYRAAALPPVYPFFLALMILVGVLLLLLSRRVATRVSPLLRRLRLERLAARMDAVHAEFRLYRAQLHWFMAVFMFAMGVQALRVLTHILVAIGLCIPLTGNQGLQLFVLVPLLGILIALPISVNGIGLREYTAADTFGVAGFSPSAAVAMQLVAYLVQVSVSLIGGWFFWAGRRRARGT
jgi:uncharacterized protein (TIRG00374 family)